MLTPSSQPQFLVTKASQGVVPLITTSKKTTIASLETINLKLNEIASSAFIIKDQEVSSLLGDRVLQELDAEYSKDVDQLQQLFQNITASGSFSKEDGWQMEALELSIHHLKDEIRKKKIEKSVTKKQVDHASLLLKTAQEVLTKVNALAEIVKTYSPQMDSLEEINAQLMDLSQEPKAGNPSLSSKEITLAAQGLRKLVKEVDALNEKGKEDSAIDFLHLYQEQVKAGVAKFPGLSMNGPTK